MESEHLNDRGRDQVETSYTSVVGWDRAWIHGYIDLCSACLDASTMLFSGVNF
jgi:hypothetical protein